MWSLLFLFGNDTDLLLIKKSLYQTNDTGFFYAPQNKWIWDFKLI